MSIFATLAVMLAAQSAAMTDATPALAARPSATVPPIVARPVPIPAPVIKFIGQTTSTKDGKTWVFYSYELVNRNAFPAVFWTPAPSLPPCGSNSNASRAWVDIYDGSGKRLYGYCAEKSTAQFQRFGFTLEAGTMPPPTVYVTITDRFTGRVFKSNEAPTSDAPPPPIIH